MARIRNVPSSTLVASAALTAACSRAAPEPAVLDHTLEDANVRIEEVRVRGIRQRLRVQPKAASAPAYEILPQDPGRDTAHDRRSAGQRVWRLLAF